MFEYSSEQLLSARTKHSRTKPNTTLPGSNQLGLHAVFVNLKNNQQSPAGGFTAS